MTFRRTCAVALALTVLPGCGELDVPWKGTRAVPTEVLAREKVERYPRGSPERALLAWWRALQQRDVAAATRAFDPALGLRREALALRLAAAQRYIGVATPPRILDVDRQSDAATLFTEASVRFALPNGGGDTVLALPQAFTLERKGGSWRLPDDLFLRYAAEASVTSPPAERAARPRLVTLRDLTRYPRESPERAALELLRVFQFNDPTRASSYLIRQWDPEPRRIARILRSWRGIAQGFGAPPISSARAEASSATLRVQLKDAQATVQMSRVDGQWKLARLTTTTGIDEPG